MRQAGVFSSLKAASDEVLPGGLEWIVGGRCNAGILQNHGTYV